jgi:HEPN domain-containing protein
MSEAVNPLAWIERAEEDYTIARSALHRKIPLIYPACFHAQQCAEKYLKAILLANFVPFPKTHDLLMLSSLIEEAGILVPVEKKALNLLNDYSVRVRYPGDSPSVEDAREALQIAQSVRRFVRKLFAL